MSTQAPQKRLYRSRDVRILAGVCGGLGKYLGVDPTIVRLLWILLILVSAGVGIILYIVAAIIIPEEPAEAPSEKVGEGAPPPTPVSNETSKLGEVILLVGAVLAFTGFLLAGDVLASFTLIKPLIGAGLLVLGILTILAGIILLALKH